MPVHWANQTSLWIKDVVEDDDGDEEEDDGLVEAVVCAEGTSLEGGEDKGVDESAAGGGVSPDCGGVVEALLTETGNACSWGKLK